MLNLSISASRSASALLSRSLSRSAISMAGSSAHTGPFPRSYRITGIPSHITNPRDLCIYKAAFIPLSARLLEERSTEYQNEAVVEVESELHEEYLLSRLNGVKLSARLAEGYGKTTIVVKSEMGESLSE